MWGTGHVTKIDPKIVVAGRTSSQDCFGHKKILLQIVHLALGATHWRMTLWIFLLKMRACIVEFFFIH
jgi:hypothetical protein